MREPIDRQATKPGRHEGFLALLRDLRAFVATCLALSLGLAGNVTGQTTGRVAGEQGDITITTFVHSSIQLEYRGTVVHIDPWTVGDLSRATPADLILVTDDVGHHLDAAAIKQLRKPGAPVVITANGKARMPDGIVLGNGESTTLVGVRVDAIGAYDLTPGEPYHPKGEANGYIVTIGGRRIYVVGVTECVPEIRAVTNIDVAFMPLNLPVNRMAVPAAIECTKALRPRVVYPYHHDQDYATAVTRGEAAAPNGRGIQEFVRGLAGESIEVRVVDWYPSRPARQR